MWDWSGDGSESLSATSATAWTATLSNIPDDGTQYGSFGNTGVIGYPDTEYKYNATDIADYGNITSSYSTTATETGSGGSYESAYDIWLGGIAGDTSAWEVMIWTDDHGQHPGGTDEGTWTDPTTDDEYTVFDNTNSSGTGGTMWFVPTTAVTNNYDGGWTSGSVDVGDALYAAVHNYDGWGNADDDGTFVPVTSLYQIDYGFEMSTTGGASGTSLALTVKSISVSTPAFTKPSVVKDEYAFGTLVTVTGSPVYLWNANDTDDTWQIPDSNVLSFLEKSGFTNNGDGIETVTAAEFSQLATALESGDIGCAFVEPDATLVRVNGESAIYMWNGTEAYHIPTGADVSLLEGVGVNDGNGPVTIPDLWDLGALGTIIS